MQKTGDEGRWGSSHRDAGARQKLRPLQSPRCALLRMGASLARSSGELESCIFPLDFLSFKYQQLIKISLNTWRPKKIYFQAGSGLPPTHHHHGANLCLRHLLPVSCVDHISNCGHTLGASAGSPVPIQGVTSIGLLTRRTNGTYQSLRGRAGPFCRLPTLHSRSWRQLF